MCSQSKLYTTSQTVYAFVSLETVFIFWINIFCQSVVKVHWPPMNTFACKLHGYIVYFLLRVQRHCLSTLFPLSEWTALARIRIELELTPAELHNNSLSEAIVHWVVDVKAEVVPGWLSSWLKRNFWLVLLHLSFSWFFNQPTKLNTDGMLTERMIYSGVSCFFWECDTYKSLQLYEKKCGSADLSDAPCIFPWQRHFSPFLEASSLGCNEKVMTIGTDLLQ